MRIWRFRVEGGGCLGVSNLLRLRLCTGTATEACCDRLFIHMMRGIRRLRTTPVVSACVPAPHCVCAQVDRVREAEVRAQGAGTVVYRGQVAVRPTVWLNGPRLAAWLAENMVRLGDTLTRSTCS